MKKTIALLSKQKDQRSLYDQKHLLPVFLQPGEHIRHFFEEQRVFGDDLLKLCINTTHQCLFDGDYVCHFGD